MIQAAPPTIETHGGALTPVGILPPLLELLWVVPLVAGLLAGLFMILWSIPKFRGKSATLTAFSLRLMLTGAGLLAAWIAFNLLRGPASLF
jgi:hypothetical protein